MQCAWRFSAGPGVSPLCSLLGLRFAGRKTPQTTPTLKGRRGSNHVTCIAPVHNPVCQLLPGFCSRIICFRALPHHRPIMPTCGVQLSLRTPTPERQSTVSQHQADCSGQTSGSLASSPGQLSPTGDVVSAVFCSLGPPCPHQENKYKDTLSPHMIVNLQTAK